MLHMHGVSLLTPETEARSGFPDSEPEIPVFADHFRFYTYGATTKSRMAASVKLWSDGRTAIAAMPKLPLRVAGQHRTTP
jgi:hypothetical protein